MTAARVASALALMARLEGEGFTFHQRPDGGVRVCPPGLDEGILQELRDLKPEIVALVAFEPVHRALLARFDVTLEELHRYRLGLDGWLLLRPEERAMLLDFHWSPEDLATLGNLVQAVGGEIIDVVRDLPAPPLEPVQRRRVRP